MARNLNPYTFSLYANGDLLVNVYGDFSGEPLCGDVCNGVAPDRATVIARASAVAARVAWKGSVDVIVWRHGKAVLRGDLATFAAECAA